MSLLPTSIRAKLTLTSVAVIGVLLVVLGVVTQVAGRARIMAGVDQDLAIRAAKIISVFNLQRNHPNAPPDGFGTGFGPPPPDGGVGGRDFGPPGGPNGRQNRAIFGRSGGPPGRPPGGPFHDFQVAVQRVGDPLLSIGPRFIGISPGPPLAPPEMTVPYVPAALETAKRAGSVFSTVILNGERVRVITMVSRGDGGRIWAVQIPYPLGGVDQALGQLTRTLLLLVPLGLMLTAGACLFLMTRVMGPIREITATAESIGAEDLSGRLNASGSDEFAHLAGTMNGMLGRIEDAFRVQRQAMARVEAVLATQRRFTADASHELKTPLAVVKANSGLILHGSVTPGQNRAAIEAIDAAATRMTKLVQGLMVLARSESGAAVSSLVPVDLGVVIQNAIDQVRKPGAVPVSFEAPSDVIRVQGVEADLERVFVNLLDNAVRYSKSGEPVSVRLFRTTGEVTVTVSDHGEGIAHEHLEYVFDRFYRVDSARSSESGGTGLGLAICKSIIEAHGGNIQIASEIGVGTTVALHFSRDVVVDRLP